MIDLLINFYRILHPPVLQALPGLFIPSNADDVLRDVYAKCAAGNGLAENRKTPTCEMYGLHVLPRRSTANRHPDFYDYNNASDSRMNGGCSRLRLALPTGIWKVLSISHIT